MQPDRLVLLDPECPLQLLTATARGLIENNFIRAAQRAHTELMTAVGDAGLLHLVRSRIGLFPDPPQAANDAACRYVAGVMFGHDMATGQGACLRPDLALSGSLAWQPIAPGRHAVFTHIGPYDKLYLTWRAIYHQWLPASGAVLRPTPPMELNLNTPDEVAPQHLHTEIWIPLA
jgi:AraC family transcriptional regulator